VPILVELTSSHLAFCHSSPHVAVVTAFWPDHVELHGSFEAYARAKETIARHQVAEDLLIVPGDPSCERFVRASRARVARFSLAGPVSEGAFVRDGGVVVRRNDVERVVADVASLPAQGRFVANLLAACVAAMAAGVPAAALAEGLRSATLPAFRHVEVARAGGVSVYDDSMAGTPAKAAAVLELFPDASVVLVAGGEVDGAAGAVHATAEERVLLEEACALARRKARRTILFGAAAAELAELLPGAEQADDLAGAVTRACAVASGAAAVVVAPMFPVAPSDREQVARVARRAAGSTPSSS
jgi:UDP-N-acetylmuramoylalanine--D-glutamate ligase